MRYLLLLALTGCLVVPKAVDTTRQVATYMAPAIQSKVGPLELRATQWDATIRVTAIRPRHCFREVWGRYEHHHSLEPDFITTPHDGGELALLIYASPLVLVSGVISAGVSAIAPSKTEQYEEPIDVVSFECPALAPKTDLDVVFPSGATLRGGTDANGALSFAIPSTEAPQGLVVLRAGGLEQTVAYSLERHVAFAPPAVAVSARDWATDSPHIDDATASVEEQRAAVEQRGFAAVRDALSTCGDRERVHGIVAAHLAIDEAGRVSSSPDHGGAAFKRCINDALAGARFPNGHAQKLVFQRQI